LFILTISHFQLHFLSVICALCSRARARARTRAHTHTHTHTQSAHAEREGEFNVIYYSERYP